jgi:hypothetical protein
VKKNLSYLLKFKFHDYVHGFPRLGKHFQPVKSSPRPRIIFLKNTLQVNQTYIFLSTKRSLQFNFWEQKFVSISHPSRACY